ncbi:MAG: nucleoside deaminase [candidate division WOR-3 bacterium]
MEQHIRLMSLALEEARKALSEGEVPVGCVVVLGGEIIARAHNRTESLRDPTAHAEILALREAAARFGDWRLEGASVYVTTEPCVMCAGALVLARVREVIYALEDEKFGAMSLYAVPADPRLNHRFRLIKGPLGDEAREILSGFFKDRRRNPQSP